MLHFTTFSYYAINSAFVANVASFAFKSEFFTRLEISDVLTDLFVVYFPSSSNHLTSESVFLTQLLRSGILLLNSLIFVARTVVAAKPLTRSIFLSTSISFFKLVYLSCIGLCQLK